MSEWRSSDRLWVAMKTDSPRAIDKDFGYLGLNLLLNLIAPKAHRGHTMLSQGFQAYFANDGHK